MVIGTLTSGLALALALVGSQRLWALLSLWRRRPDDSTPWVSSKGLNQQDYLTMRRPDSSAMHLRPLDADEASPTVTVQVPLFNEPAVAARVVEACYQLQWPNQQLCLQVLDDSTDETPAIVAATLVDLQQRIPRAGMTVQHLRRVDRSAYKAGALAAGLDATESTWVAIFDADFLPQATFLREALSGSVDDVDVIQCRWGHLNADESWLTEAQAVFLDAHFTLDHQARADDGRFFPFNGTAGLWRRQCIIDAGGWDGGTLTEDLDLSARAWAMGARFRYRDDVVVPAELPATPTAWLSQQHRWAQGSMQVLRRHGGTIWRSQRPWWARIDALARMAQNLSFPLLLAVMVLLPAAAVERLVGSPLPLVDVLALGLGVLPMVVGFYVVQRRRGVSPLGALRRVAGALAAGTALALNNGRAALRGLVLKGGVFVRTPKAGTSTTRRASLSPAKRAQALPAMPRIHRLAVAVVCVWSLAGAIALTVVGRPELTVFMWLAVWGTARLVWWRPPMPPAVDAAALS